MMRDVLINILNTPEIVSIGRQEVIVINCF